MARPPKQHAHSEIILPSHMPHELRIEKPSRMASAFTIPSYASPIRWAPRSCDSSDHTPVATTNDGAVNDAVPAARALATRTYLVDGAGQEGQAHLHDGGGGHDKGDPDGDTSWLADLGRQWGATPPSISTPRKRWHPTWSVSV